MWKASSFRGKCSGSPDSARVAPHRSWDIICRLLDIWFTTISGSMFINMYLSGKYEHHNQYVFEGEIWTSQVRMVDIYSFVAQLMSRWISQHFWFLNIFYKVKFENICNNPFSQLLIFPKKWKLRERRWEIAQSFAKLPEQSTLERIGLSRWNHIVFLLFGGTLFWLYYI